MTHLTEDVVKNMIDKLSPLIDYLLAEENKLKDVPITDEHSKYASYLGGMVEQARTCCENVYNDLVIFISGTQETVNEND